MSEFVLSTSTLLNYTLEDIIVLPSNANNIEVSLEADNEMFTNLTENFHLKLEDFDIEQLTIRKRKIEILSCFSCQTTRNMC